jgi:hypothetical protein
MTRLAIAVAPLVLIQLPAACAADGSAPGGDSGAGDFFVGDTFLGDPSSSGDSSGDGYVSGDNIASGDNVFGDTVFGDAFGDSHSGGDALSGDTSPCPPTGGFGTSVGDVLPSVTLQDCDGNSHNLHELCERDAGWIFVFSGW